ncbi:MAG TPA: alkaline phosphatase family protein [Flavilitoribacter sp.]|nr:alkaline phosphatase family protein [Flavilitoribacter sp.]
MRFSKNITAFFAFVLLTAPIFGQKAPKLVVGIVIDQMRYDYLYRFQGDMSETGFKRLLREGNVMHDGHYAYVPTLTAPGHSCIYTGTGPAMNGIIGNNWYSRPENRVVYCAEDSTANTVGSGSVNGKMSPRRLTSTTLADQLELATNRRSKPIGISLKDRGAIMPVGYLADGAYWYDGSNGHFITSDYYRKSLPDWVEKFNDRKLPDQFLDQPWTTLLPLDRYDETLPDDQPKERPFLNTERPVFPYDLKKITSVQRFGVGESKYGILMSSPYGNSLTLEMAKAAIEGEQLGQDSITDLLAVSFSSTDYIGHQFGPQSVEIQDIYLRLDLTLSNLFQYLDSKIGLNNVLIFLTADHAAADIPGYISPPAGYFKAGDFEEGLRQHLVKKFKKDPVESFINEQLYFTKPLYVDKDKLEGEVRAYAAGFPGVYGIIPLDDFGKCVTDPSVCDKIRKGIMPDRSGDLYVQLYPGWIANYYEKGGTTHGSPYAYDTHVPIIFFGWEVRHSDNRERVWVEDIAPTVCDILHITRPSGCTGSVIPGVLFRG